MSESDSERLVKGKRVPFSIADLMQVLMQLPSAPVVQTAEPGGLERKPRSGTFGGHEGSVNRVAVR